LPIALLEQVNLIYRLPPAALGGKKVLKARNKYYLVDAALRNAILLKGEEIFTNPNEMGLIVTGHRGQVSLCCARSRHRDP
jgi:hypothetical protein